MKINPVLIEKNLNILYIFISIELYPTYKSNTPKPIQDLQKILKVNKVINKRDRETFSVYF